jgi:hypothetical protein
MYELVLALHSLLRWVVILSAIAVLFRVVPGWFGGRAWTSADASASQTFVVAMTLQFVVGALLWAGLSPYGVSGMSDMAATMKDATRRFWAVEHLTMMLIAVAVAHVGAARARKATEDGRKHRTTAIFFALALVLTLLAIPWTGPDARPWLRWF